MFVAELTIQDDVDWQPGDLRALRGVAGGVAEEARTRGFASPALAGFAFIKRRCGGGFDLKLQVGDVRKLEWVQLSGGTKKAKGECQLSPIADV